MRIAIVTPGFSASDDDWCIPVLQDIARSLHASHDVEVYTTCYPFSRGRYEVKGVPVTSFGDGRSGRMAWLWRQYRAIRELSDVHRCRAFDVVHGFWADGGGFVGARLKRRFGVPVVVSVMAGELTFVPEVAYGKGRRPIAGRIARYGARHADTVLAQSHWHGERIRRAAPDIEPMPIDHGVDTGRFTPEGEAESLAGEMPVLSCGSLVPVKGHRDLLRAFEIALRTEPRLHLHIVGDGEAASTLHRQVTDNGLDRAVTFHGRVDHDRMPAFYRGASFCVSASWFESHGMVFTEAAACGIPTIGTGVGTLAEICLPELVTEPGDDRGLASAILRTAQGPALREAAASFGLSTVRSRYRFDQSVAALDGLYAQAMANAAGSR